MAANGMLLRIDAGGVIPILVMVSGFAAQERGSSVVEPLDLIKAIYIVDLEHVSLFWNDWEGFERFVCSASNGEKSNQYLNRGLYLVRLELASRENEGELLVFGTLSSDYQRIVSEARRLASQRAGAAVTPTSRDLLFGACSLYAALSKSLQESGLQLARLEKFVQGGQPEERSQ